MSSLNDNNNNNNNNQFSFNSINAQFPTLFEQLQAQTILNQYIANSYQNLFLAQNQQQQQQQQQQQSSNLVSPKLNKTNCKNLEKFNYLNNLITNSTQLSNLELEKCFIYEHRLFPLMKFMFEKCEQATLNPEMLSCKSRNTNLNISKLVQNDCIDIDNEIKKFIKENESKLNDQTLSYLLLNSQNENLRQLNTSLDQLMINTILVLRINLLEMEKVNDLCNDFSEKYVEALKIKLNSDNIFKLDEDEDEFDSNRSEIGSKLKKNIYKKQKLDHNHHHHTSTPIKQEATSPFETSPDLTFSKIKFNLCNNSANNSTTHSTDSSNQSLFSTSSSSNDLEEDYQSISNRNSLFNNEDNLENETENENDEELSLNIEDETFDEDESSSLKSQVSANPDKSNKFMDDSSSKNKRGVLPKSATNVMKRWLFQHIVHPYPTEEEKKQIATKTNLTLIQVNNWFINARRRILQPMLEASNPDLTKKKKANQVSNSKPYQNNRYWPSNLSNLQLKPKSNEDIQKYTIKKEDDSKLKATKENDLIGEKKNENNNLNNQSQSQNQSYNPNLYLQYFNNPFLNQFQYNNQNLLLFNQNTTDLVTSTNQSTTKNKNGFKIENLLGNANSEKKFDHNSSLIQQQIYHHIQSLQIVGNAFNFNNQNFN